MNYKTKLLSVSIANKLANKFSPEAIQLLFPSAKSTHEIPSKQASVERVGKDLTSTEGVGVGNGELPPPPALFFPRGWGSGG